MTMNRLVLKCLTSALTLCAALLGGPVSGALAATVGAQNDDGVAIIIGNRGYSDKDIPNVDYAHRDAEAIRRFVKESLGFRDENIIMLKDATQAQMQSAFGRQGNHKGWAYQYVRSNRSDLFVFFSGHGVPGIEEGGSFLLPSNADAETAEINGYPVSLLYHNLGKIQARSVTVFLDACFTGQSHSGPLLKGASGIQVMPRPEKTDTPMTVITAATGDQLASWDEDAKHGLFTEYLLRALYGEADKDRWGDGDGKVTLDEVEKYLADEMRYRARRAYNREQEPTVIGESDRVLVAAAEGGVFPSRPTLGDLAPEITPQITTPTAPPADLTLDPLETEMTALKNANVRTWPTVKSKKVTTLRQGTRVQVPGKVQGEPWYAVERDGKQIGYVYAPLLGNSDNLTGITQGMADEAALRDPRDVMMPKGYSLQTWLDRVNARLARGKQARVITEAKAILVHYGPYPQVQDALDRALLAEEIKNPDNSNDKIAAKRTRVYEILDRMSEVLKRQHYRKQVQLEVACQNWASSGCKTEAVSALSYRKVQGDSLNCAMVFNMDMEHDGFVSWKNKRVGEYFENRRFELDLKADHSRRLRLAEIKDHKNNTRAKKQLFTFGPAQFVNRKARDRFAEMASRLRNLCNQPGVLAAASERQAEPYRDDRPTLSRPDYRRPPPPPLRDGHRRPPPPKRW
jgi:hypothetical protein